MDVGLHSWVSTRYNRSLHHGTLFTRGLLYFKPTSTKVTKHEKLRVIL